MSSGIKFKNACRCHFPIAIDAIPVVKLFGFSWLASSPVVEKVTGRSIYWVHCLWTTITTDG